ncbi:MAG: DUF192 domain-containing protein [Deltaproteobacteria bacterium]|nr:DUF192 domain-containing protein [Deltaproteobacteria bacterium]
MSLNASVLKPSERTRPFFSRLEVASTIARRTIGLMFRASMEAGEGLLIPNCRAIHTFGMRFSIDVLFLDASYKIVTIRENVAPGQVVICRQNGVHTLEIPAGSVKAANFSIGEKFLLEDPT